MNTVSRFTRVFATLLVVTGLTLIAYGYVYCYGPLWGF